MLLLDLYHSCKMHLVKTSESKDVFVHQSWYIHTGTCIGIQTIFSMGVTGGESFFQKIFTLPQLPHQKSYTIHLHRPAYGVQIILH